MPAADASPVPVSAALKEHKMTVLLVDDQAMVAEAVKRMLAPETDIVFHYCQDPTKAIETATRISPTIILQDLVMPEVDGLVLVKFYRANAATRDIPLIVLSSKEEPVIKAQAFALGANDYLVKLPDRIELVARIRYHSRAYINLLERNEAYQALLESKRALAEDVAQAEKYVISLLPEPLTDPGAVTAQWRFIPSAVLGGDSFGYHWIDDDNFAFYLLDVCGHGVKAALLSVSAMNVLRSQSLPDCDFRDPAQVLAKLNEAFPMEKHYDMYFTMWYGVFHRARREIQFAGGGHPPALLLTGPSAAAAACHDLKSQGPMVGAFEDAPFSADTCRLEAFARLYLFSDGVFEIHQPSGETWAFEDFWKVMTRLGTDSGNAMDGLIDHARTIGGDTQFADDFSIVEFEFA